MAVERVKRAVKRKVLGTIFKFGTLFRGGVVAQHGVGEALQNQRADLTGRYGIELDLPLLRERHDLVRHVLWVRHLDEECAVETHPGNSCDVRLADQVMR